jgi:hypothetical protein
MPDYSDHDAAQANVEWRRLPGWRLSAEKNQETVWDKNIQGERP